VAPEPESIVNNSLFGSNVTDEEVRRETSKRAWADAARYTHWAGIAFLGTFLIPLFNILPPRFTEPTWQLNLISLIISQGMGALLGATLLSLAYLFNPSDRQVQNRALLVRTLASWVALGWLLLIPAQLFLGMRLINTQAGQELGQIGNFKRISSDVRNATTEDELRAALAKVPNTPPIGRLTVPLEVAKANVLSQLQKSINTLENRQEQGSSDRWQIWMKEALRNSLQCVLLATGFIAIGKNRSFETAKYDSPPSRGSRSRSRV
jgi:hypothetical protein